MKSWQLSLIGLLAATVMLGACSKQEKPAEPAPATVAAPAPAPVVNEPGGYVPTEEERYHSPAGDAAATTAPVSSDAASVPETTAPATSK